MDVFSNMDAVVVYSGNHLNTNSGKNKRGYNKNDGICFETQYVANAVNVEGFTKPLFDKNQHFINRTEFRFSKQKEGK